MRKFFFPSGDHLRTSAYENNPFKHHILHRIFHKYFPYLSRFSDKRLKKIGSLVAFSRGAANKGVPDTIFCWIYKLSSFCTAFEQHKAPLAGKFQVPCEIISLFSLASLFFTPQSFPLSLFLNS